MPLCISHLPETLQSAWSNLRETGSHGTTSSWIHNWPMNCPKTCCFKGQVSLVWISVRVTNQESNLELRMLFSAFGFVELCKPVQFLVFPCPFSHCVFLKLKIQPSKKNCFKLLNHPPILSHYPNPIQDRFEQGFFKKGTNFFPGLSQAGEESKPAIPTKKMQTGYQEKISLQQ